MASAGNAPGVLASSLSTRQAANRQVRYPTSQQVVHMGHRIASLSALEVLPGRKSRMASHSSAEGAACLTPTYFPAADLDVPCRRLRQATWPPVGLTDMAWHCRGSSTLYASIVCRFRLLHGAGICRCLLHPGEPLRKCPARLWVESTMGGDEDRQLLTRIVRAWVSGSDYTYLFTLMPLHKHTSSPVQRPPLGSYTVMRCIEERGPLYGEN